MKIFSSKKRVAIIGAVTAVTLVGGGTAFAYWTSSGTGSGSATVGSAVNWTVEQATSTGTMYPGHGSSVVTFTATNESSGFQQLGSDDVVATVDAVSGNITVGSPATVITGCLATWFVPTVGLPDPAWDTNVDAGDPVSIPVNVTMTNESVNQNACQGKAPNLTLSITAAAP
jgi:hypothetical protein